MSFYKAFFAVALILNALLVAYFALFDTLSSVINLELAALGSVAILSATYFGYKKMIESKIAQSSMEENRHENDAKDDGEDEEEQTEQKPSAISAVTSSYKGYLFPLRLLSYTVFATSFVYLSSSVSLEIAAFFAGLAVAPVSILLTMLWFKQTQMEIKQ